MCYVVPIHPRAESTRSGAERVESGMARRFWYDWARSFGFDMMLGSMTLDPLDFDGDRIFFGSFFGPQVVAQYNDLGVWVIGTFLGFQEFFSVLFISTKKKFTVIQYGVPQHAVAYQLTVCRSSDPPFAGFQSLRGKYSQFGVLSVETNALPPRYPTAHNEACSAGNPAHAPAESSMTYQEKTNECIDLVAQHSHYYCLWAPSFRAVIVSVML